MHNSNTIKKDYAMETNDMSNERVAFPGMVGGAPDLPVFEGMHGGGK